MNVRLWIPLVLYVVPTVVIGFGYVIPNSCIAGVNGLTVGFGLSVVSASITYVVGVTTALRQRDGRKE